MPLNLHKIKLDSKSRELLTNKNKFPELRRVFREIATDAVDSAADFALIASKSVVPIDTLELRGTNLTKGKYAFRGVNRNDTTDDVPDPILNDNNYNEIIGFYSNAPGMCKVS